ncbi:hypothetical protein JMUB6875_74290 [Nocardia sp. JMUB6875]
MRRTARLAMIGAVAAAALTAGATPATADTGFVDSGSSASGSAATAGKALSDLVMWLGFVTGSRQPTPCMAPVGLCP